MIANVERTTILSSCGWLEGDALWHLDARSGKVATVPLQSGARYLSLHHANKDRFAVAHHFDGSRFEVSVRSFSAPRVILGRASLAPGESHIDGDETVWSDVPHLYAEYLGFAPWNDFVLVKVNPSAGKIEIQPFKWFDDSYDKAYQGVIDVLALPGQHRALVAVGRSSRLILHNLKTGRKVRSIKLAGGYPGNPHFELRASGTELWTTAYDAVVVLRTTDCRVRKSIRLQAARGRTQQFIGDISFLPDRNLCAVARPFSHDVVALDVDSLEIAGRAKLGRQPRELMTLSEGVVVARDWKSGELLQGTLDWNAKDVRLPEAPSWFRKLRL